MLKNFLLQGDRAGLPRELGGHAIAYGERGGVGTLRGGNDPDVCGRADVLRID